jgi:hypothetical protein
LTSASGARPRAAERERVEEVVELAARTSGTVLNEVTVKSFDDGTADDQ